MTPVKKIERLHDMGLVEYDYTTKKMCKLVKCSFSSEIIVKIDLEKKTLSIVNGPLWKQLTADYKASP